MYDLLRPVPDALPETEALTDTLTGARQALLRLERASADRTVLLHARHLIHGVEAACRRLGLDGPERAAAAAGRALDRTRSSALPVTPDLVTCLLRAFDHAWAALVAPWKRGADRDGDAVGIAEALDALAAASLGFPKGTANPAGTPPVLLTALVVEAGGRRFAIPRARVVDPAADVAGGSLPLVDLSDVLGLPRAVRGRSGTYVVVAAGAGALCLAVDRVLDAQPVTARPTAPILRRSPMLGGSAALGDGEVVMVLDVDGIAAAVAAGRRTEQPPVAPSTLRASPSDLAVRNPLSPPARACRGAGPRVMLIEENGGAGVPAPRIARFRPSARWIARAPTPPGSPPP